MSDTTKAALDAAIQAHIEDEEPGAMLTGYVLQTQYTSMDFLEDQLTGYLRMIAEGQNFTTTLGLTHYMSRQLDHDMLTGDDS